MLVGTGSAFVHLAKAVAFSVMGMEKSKGSVQAKSVYHPPKIQPSTDGACGSAGTPL